MMIGLGQEAGTCLEYSYYEGSAFPTCTRWAEVPGPPADSVPTPPAKTVKLSFGGKDYVIRERDIWIAGALVAGLILVLVMT